MRIKWSQEEGGDFASPEWEVESVVLFSTAAHTVVTIRATDEQVKALQDQYGKNAIPLDVVGIRQIHLTPGACLWEKPTPEGMSPKVIPLCRYRMMEVLP